MSDAASRIPVIFFIDVEPDPLLVNRAEPEPWDGYAATQTYLTDLRARFEQATGSPVHYTWGFRMDPQVAQSYGSATYAVDRFPAFTQACADHGDDFASHPHVYRWLEDRQQWLEDFANQDWVEETIEVSLEAHKKAFGTACRTCRLGNYWMNNQTIDFMERQGIRYDMTVEPGLAKREPKRYQSGVKPDYQRVPRRPYEPRMGDFRSAGPPGSRQLKIIPLSAGYLRGGRNLWVRWRRLRANGLKYRRQDTPLQMYRQWREPNSFEAMVDRAIAAQQKPYLAFAIRTSIGVGKSFEAVNASLEALLAHPQRERFVFSTPQEALDLLDAN